MFKYTPEHQNYFLNIRNMDTWIQNFVKQRILYTLVLKLSGSCLMPFIATANSCLISIFVLSSFVKLRRFISGK